MTGVQPGIDDRRGIAGTPAKVAFLMHSVLNMNVRAPGIAVHRGPIEDLYHFLMDRGFEVVQIPCPETTYVGLRRWWFTRELYDSVGYRRHCRRLAEAVCDLAEAYHRQGARLYFVGMGLSPTCGLRMTQSDPAWGGKPFEVPLDPPAVPGKGVFVEELEQALAARGIPVQMSDVAPAAIYPPYRVPAAGPYPTSLAAAIEEVKRFLDA